MPKVVIVNDVKPAKDIVGILKGMDVGVVETTMDEYLTVLSIEGADCLILNVSDIENAKDILVGVKSYDDSIPVIVIREGGAIDEVVSMMKGGACDYIQRPVDAEHLKISLANAIHLYDLTKRVYLLENQMGWHSSFDNIIGHSHKMQEIFQGVTAVSKSNATILILGESGTGKELVARALHNHSPRAEHPFIDINCGAIPRELLENELFGHERGAYTGADRRYIGCCERAHKGTLFLDEICEMEPALQVKILRLLQERSFTRVGGNSTITVDIRFVAATNKKILEEVKKGNFREDLYYRLNVVPIHIPPLRERSEDIPLLAKHFLDKFSAKNEKIFVDFAPDTLSCLINYDWPGNVRELENVIERVVVLYNDSQVKIKYLPPQVQKVGAVSSSAKTFPMQFGNSQKIIPLDMVEKYVIESAIAKCLGDVKAAAEQLKIGQATLYRKIRQYGLKV